MILLTWLTENREGLPETLGDNPPLQSNWLITSVTPVHRQALD